MKCFCVTHTPRHSAVMASEDENALLPHKLSSLRGLKVDRVLNDGKESGVVALLVRSPLGRLENALESTPPTSTPDPEPSLCSPGNLRRVLLAGGGEALETAHTRRRSRRPLPCHLLVRARAVERDGVRLLPRRSRPFVRPRAERGRALPRVPLRRVRGRTRKASEETYKQEHSAGSRGVQGNRGGLRECARAVHSRHPEGAIGWSAQDTGLGEGETERLLFNDPTEDAGFLLNTDPKWTTHPDHNTTPKAMWNGHASTRDLYCLGLCHRRDVKSLRDLRREHLPMLRAMAETGRRVIRETYGLEDHSVRVFVHYPPQFYHFPRALHQRRRGHWRAGGASAPAGRRHRQHRARL